MAKAQSAAAMFFLTAVDTERLDIRGSRDPLGLVPIWGDFGRTVVENLTTPSNSVRGFTTLLLGLYFAERVSSGESDAAVVRLEAFLKFEQLAGFVRVVRNHDESMRGITQIKRRLAEEGERRIRIGAGRDLQILSNQKTYGLWGLFMMPAIASGLVVPKDTVLTSAARELVESEYLPCFERRGLGDGGALEGLLSKKSSELEPNGRHSKLFDSLAEILGKPIRKKEREVYKYHLVRGGQEAEKKCWQPRFVEVFERVLPASGAFDRASLDLVIAAMKSPADLPLRHQLERIRDLEMLLVASSNLFGFLQHRDNAKVRSVTGELKAKWGSGLRSLKSGAISEMRADFARVLGDSGAADRLVELGKSLHDGSFEKSIELAISHNKFIMHKRNGSQPWMAIASGKLDVAYRDDIEEGLLDPLAIASTWRSTFYINSLKSISDELRAVQ